MNEHFVKLIRGFCATVNLANPEKMISGVPFTINQVVFSLANKQVANQSLLFIHVDFGDLPKGSEAETCYELLRENFFEFPLANSSFGISAATGRAVYTTAFPLDELTVDELIVTLTALTCQAKRWQADHARVSRPPIFGIANQKWFSFASLAN